MKIRVSRIAVWLGAALLLDSTLVVALPVVGYVFDAETGIPIEGVRIESYWEERLIVSMEYQSRGNAMTIQATTDRHGRYVLPPWVSLKLPWHVIDERRRPALELAKRGYEPRSVESLESSEGELTRIAFVYWGGSALRHIQMRRGVSP